MDGRVHFVTEPNAEVTPLLGRLESQRPTILASLDQERFLIAVETAQADVVVAQRRLDANRVNIEQRLPTSIDTAEAERKLAEMDLSRLSQLVKQKAISRAELDAAITRLTGSKSSFLEPLI